VKLQLGPSILLSILGVGFLYGGARALREAGLEQSISCKAIDGDTIHCASESIRLNGIDAPERGTGTRAKVAHAYLQLLVNNTTVSWHPLKKDRYGRTVAQVFAHDADLSCAMVLSGNAAYVRKWDEQQLTGKCIQAAGDL
jgi:micrococcal nuclease